MAKKNTKHKVTAPARSLTAKQQRFCEEYIVDLNATQAALRAGYSENNARFQGCENLTKPNIQTEIQKLKSKRSERVQIEADSVIKELVKLAFSNIEDFLEVLEGGEVTLKAFEVIEREKLAAIESIKINTTKNKDESREYTTTQFKLHSKLNALEQLGKHLGIYKNRVEVTGDDGGPVQIQVVHFTKTNNNDIGGSPSTK